MKNISDNKVLPITLSETFQMQIMALVESHYIKMSLMAVKHKFWVEKPIMKQKE